MTDANTEHSSIYSFVPVIWHDRKEKWTLKIPIHLSNDVRVHTGTMHELQTASYLLLPSFGGSMNQTQISHKLLKPKSFYNNIIQGRRSWNNMELVYIILLTSTNFLEFKRKVKMYWLAFLEKPKRVKICMHPHFLCAVGWKLTASN